MCIKKISLEFIGMPVHWFVVVFTLLPMFGRYSDVDTNSGFDYVVNNVRETIVRSFWHQGGL